MSDIYSDLLDHLELDPFTLSDDTAIITAAEMCTCELCGMVF